VTSFDEIYTVNGAIMKELRATNKPDNLYYFILYQYLRFATAVFSQYSYTDLDDKVNFEQFIDTFESDGIETNFALDFTPIAGGDFYVGIDNVKLDESEYSYDEATNSITTDFGGDYVYVSSYEVGQFNNTLNEREIIILADAMTEWFVESFTNDPKQLEQLMYSGVKMFSQSQQNKVNISIEEYRNSKSFKSMIYYSYGVDMPSTVQLSSKGGVSY